MNKPTILFYTLTALFFSISATLHAQTTVGLRAGVNFSNIGLINEQGEQQNTRAIPRLQAGLVVDIPVLYRVSLQTGVLYSGKGFQQDGGWIAASGSEFTAKAAYVEVPLNVLYKQRFGASGIMFLGAGPYVGYGTGGRWEAEGMLVVGDIVLSDDTGDIVFKEDVMDGEFGSYLYGKPWDYGANVLLGYEFPQRISIQFSAQFGIANLQPKVGGEVRDGSIRNRGYGISLGYKF